MNSIENLLLLALPASGKSEIRRYIDHLDPAMRRRDLYIGEPVHLDDYPYVPLMRRISRESAALGTGPLFFDSPENPFVDPADWGTLVELVAEDWASLQIPPPCVEHAGIWLLDRMDRARARVGITPQPLTDPGLRLTLADAIEPEARRLVDEISAGRPLDLGGRTVIIEFARGGPEGVEPPIPPPRGYRHSLSLLPAGLLRRAAILYVWVTPEESRRRNLERAVPGEEGERSILHHRAPERVMREDYGTDDMAWMLRTARRPGTVSVASGGEMIDVPAVVFDNRDDLTSFLRSDPDSWPQDATADLHDRLGQAMERLHQEMTLEE